MRTLSHDDDLLQPVRSSNCHLILSANPVDCFFDILVCGLGFFGIYHVNVMIGKNFFHVSFHLVSVKYKDQCTFAVSLIVAQDIHQLIAGRVDIFFCQLIQLFPGKNDVVSIDKEIFFLAWFSLSIADGRC